VPDYPTLSDWLRNAKSGSPWLPFFHGTAQDPGICGALETILGRLEATNPSGLGSLKKRFGDDDEGNVFGLRTELLIGFQLAEAGIPFRFGGRAEPDVKCELTHGVWIEARTRSRDDVLLLQRDLRVALGNSPVNAILSFERRLAVSEGERNAIIRRVLEAVESLVCNIAPVGRGTPSTPRAGGGTTTRYGSSAPNFAGSRSSASSPRAGCPCSCGVPSGL
jgi:hypothetical protein